MTKTLPLFKTLIWILGVAGLSACAFGTIPGPTSEFTVHEGAWYQYKRNCSGCHGLRGDGIIPIGPPLRGNAFVVNARPQDIATVIRSGRKDDTKRYPQYLREADGYMNMPPFAELSISDSEMATLVKYLKGPFQQGKFNQP